MLLSGSTTVTIFGCLILFTAFWTHGFLYRMAGDLMVALASDVASGTQFLGCSRAWLRNIETHADKSSAAPVCRWIVNRNECCDREPASQYDSDYDDSEYGGDDGQSSHTRTSPSMDGSLGSDRQLLGDVEKGGQKASSPRWRRQLGNPCSPSVSRIAKCVASAFVGLTLLIRPPVPYNHMSVTLPASLADVLHSHGPPLDCFERSRQAFKNPWPFPDLIIKEKWEQAKGHFKGWAPGPDSSLAAAYRNKAPGWLLEKMPHGFQRWDPSSWGPGWEPPNHPGHGPPPHHPPHHGPPHGPHGHHGPPPPPPGEECPPQDIRTSFYNPVEDPLKISNFDNDPLPQLKDALASVKIRNVVFILMEALRAEMFPLRKDSLFHNIILEANEEEDREEINRQLAHLTPNIDRITGGIGGFQDLEGDVPTEGNSTWREKMRDGHGGINVLGAMTASTLSTKSYSSNLCGTWPMAVKNFDEADTESYQPCLPQILSLLNSDKGETNSTGDEGSDRAFINYPWRTALFESMTETFDRQDKFDGKLGWDKIVAQSELKKDKSRYKVTDPLYQKLGYLGFAEPVLEPYFKDFIEESRANNERMFMMHFTSITHHPWELPPWFNTTDYMPPRGHRDLNKYLNTIRYHDYWMGELMRIFDETNIADETLVVFVGDHGQAFIEDTKKQGTYENGHVSNFRVPITFRHPHLPRVQYEANATSISILPTILDLLVNTGSLNDKDAKITSDIMYDYEGQSLLRPYKPFHNGRRAWNFAIVNSGAGILGVTSADTNWRMVLPLTDKFEYKLSDLAADPMERDVVAAWSLDDLVSEAKPKFGQEAADWAVEAESVAQWWIMERKRLWRHD